MATTKTKPKAPIVYATESFIAVVHQDPVELDDIQAKNFQVELDQKKVKLTDWTLSYLPHLNTSLLLPPKVRRSLRRRDSPPANPGSQGAIQA